MGIAPGLFYINNVSTDDKTHTYNLFDKVNVSIISCDHMNLSAFDAWAKWVNAQASARVGQGLATPLILALVILVVIGHYNVCCLLACDCK